MYFTVYEIGTDIVNIVICKLLRLNRLINPLIIYLKSWNYLIETKQHNIIFLYYLDKIFRKLFNKT